MYKAFLFDLNGTMIDDMEFHGRAWKIILNELGAGMSDEQVKAQMFGRNDELIRRVFGSRFSQSEMEAIGLRKEAIYQKEYLPHLVLIEGLDQFLLDASNRNILLGIGSAALPLNIDFAIDNLHIRHYFHSIVSAKDVAHSKPHPETYLKLAKQLGCQPEECIVFEDAPKGVEAAHHAGMKSVVLLGMHQPADFQYHSSILMFIDNYHNEQLLSLVE